jgi:hypothetical protein
MLLSMGSGVTRSKPQRETVIPTTLARNNVIVSLASQVKELVDFVVLPDDSGSLGISRSKGSVTLTSVKYVSSVVYLNGSSAYECHDPARCL